MTKSNSVISLTTVDGETLLARPLLPTAYLIDNLLGKGLYVMAGASKIGKSWLALWLCMQISTGRAVWDFQTEQGTALYLCLEDSENRIQNRLHSIVEEDSDLSGLHFATQAQTMALGLELQIEMFCMEHPDTKLVVIDTLQKVRDSSKDAGYANDYTELGRLKTLADTLGITILLIHHLRKTADADPFNMISGTTGITGVVDGSFVLTKDRHTGKAQMLCTGRDIPERELSLAFDGETHLWTLLADSEIAEPDDLEKLVFSIFTLLQAEKSFCGSASDLLSKLPADVAGEFVPNTLSKRLLQNESALLLQGVSIQHRRTNGKRVLELALSGELSK